MQNKRNTGGSKALRVLTVIIGALMTLVGMLSASGDMDKILEGIGVGGGLLSFAKTMEKLPVWNNTTLALVGLLLIGGVLNGIDVKKRDSAALNSKLIRRPVQRLYLVFLAPTFAAFCLGFLYPFVKGIFLSFCRFKTTSKWTWVGFDNYVSAFNDPSFLHAFWYTAIFAVTSLILINVLSFAVAYALTRGIRGTNIFRTVFFMPNLIGGIGLYLGDDIRRRALALRYVHTAQESVRLLGLADTHGVAADWLHDDNLHRGSTGRAGGYT